MAHTSLLYFFTLTAWMSPYDSGAFDTRRVSKERWTLIFFISGLSVGLLSFRENYLLWAFAAAMPWVLVKIFEILRMPAQRVLYLPKQIRWILALLCAIDVVGRLL